MEHTLFLLPCGLSPILLSTAHPPAPEHCHCSERVSGCSLPEGLSHSVDSTAWSPTGDPSPPAQQEPPGHAPCRVPRHCGPDKGSYSPMPQCSPGPGDPPGLPLLPLCILVSLDPCTGPALCTRQHEPRVTTEAHVWSVLRPAVSVNYAPGFEGLVKK